VRLSLLESNLLHGASLRLEADRRHATRRNICGKFSKSTRGLTALRR
jgi:hypothetical protein